MDRIFINNNGSQTGWIMDILTDDIIREARAKGIECNKGSYKDYKGEEIVYHQWYTNCVPMKEAKHNSVFYTHLNFALREDYLVSIKDKFDSFICMSPEDAQFLIELGFDKNKVFGKILPVRNTYIKPISIGIFSACYEDGRKNEKWLLDYAQTHENARFANFVFVGKGWQNVASSLDVLNCSYEWLNISRKMPYEYQYQQNRLADLDYYIYMGMDGGAMGTYDAYAQDVPLCVTFDGFHKAIPDIDYPFDNQEGFNEQLDNILSKHVRRLSFFKENNPENYASWLIKVWTGQIDNILTEKDKKCLSFESVVEKKRKQYYPLTWKRLKSLLQNSLSRKVIEFNMERSRKRSCDK